MRSLFTGPFSQTWENGPFFERRAPMGHFYMTESIFTIFLIKSGFLQKIEVLVTYCDRCFAHVVDIFWSQNRKRFFLGVNWPKKSDSDTDFLLWGSCQSVYWLIVTSNGLQGNWKNFNRRDSARRNPGVGKISYFIKLSTVPIEINTQNTVEIRKNWHLDLQVIQQLANSSFYFVSYRL